MYTYIYCSDTQGETLRHIIDIVNVWDPHFVDHKLDAIL